MSNGEGGPGLPITSPPPFPPFSAPNPTEQYLESGVLIATALSGIPGVNLAAFALVALANLAQFLVSVFTGVPHDAKTLGAGQELIHSTDPIAAYLGGQMISGAKSGRVISESKGTASFELILGSLFHALLSLANRGPTGAFAHNYGTVSGSPNVWGFSKIPPPPGAPYSEDVSVFHTPLPEPLDAAGYQTKYGFPTPTNQQIVDFINSGKVLTWQQVSENAPSIASLFGLIDQNIANEYASWLSPNPGAGGLPPMNQPPGVEIPTTSGDELLDIGTAILGTLNAIELLMQALQPSTGGPGDQDCCTKLLAELTLVAGAVGGLPAAIAAALPTTAPTLDLTAIVAALVELITAVNSIATSLATGTTSPTPDLCDCLKTILQPISDALANATPPATPAPSQIAWVDGFIQQLVADGRLNATDAQIIPTS